MASVCDSSRRSPAFTSRWIRSNAGPTLALDAVGDRAIARPRHRNTPLTVEGRVEFIPSGE
jgi:hypothetical protein